MSAPTTPNRKTHVRLDPPDAVLLEPVLAQQRAAVEMARGSGAETENLWLKAQTGWQLEPLQRRAFQVQEGANAVVLGSADLQTPSGFTQQPAFRQAKELTGVSYAAGVPASGDLFWQKGVASGDDWSGTGYVLSSDQASYPSPTAGRENASLDRVAVSTRAYAPDQTFFLRFRLPGVSAAAPDRVLTFYFPGPAGTVSDSGPGRGPGKGTGAYALCFGGDGYAELYERQTDATWAGPDRFAYTAPQHVGLATHLVAISPQIAQLNPKLSGLLLFEFARVHPPPVAQGLGPPARGQRRHRLRRRQQRQRQPHSASLQAGPCEPGELRLRRLCYFRPEFP